MPSFQERAIEEVQLALEMPIDGRAWFLLARAAIWALLAIAKSRRSDDL